MLRTRRDADPARDLLALSVAPSCRGHHLGRRVAGALCSTPSDLQVEQAVATAPVTCPVSLPCTGAARWRPEDVLRSSGATRPRGPEFRLRLEIAGGPPATDRFRHLAA